MRLDAVGQAAQTRPVRRLGATAPVVSHFDHEPAVLATRTDFDAVAPLCFTALASASHATK